MWLEKRDYSDKLEIDKSLRQESFVVRNFQISKSILEIKLGLLLVSHTIQCFQNLKTLLSEIHLLLTPDRELGMVFEKVPIIGFSRAKSFNDILLRAKVAPLEKKKSCCRSCEGTRCKICKHVVTTETLRSFSTKRENCIKCCN